MAKELNMLNKSLQENLDLTAYSQVGHTHKYAGSSTAGGAATSATKLASARKINGTGFDGTGDITTANWGTARTITIGNSGKSVNGSGNVGWTLAEIGAAPTVHNHTFVESVDTRDTNPNPNTYTKRGLTPEFKSSTTIGLPNVGNGFTGLLTYQQWSDVSSWTGGKTTQFGTIDDGRMYYRKGDGSGWGSWYQFYTTQNKPTYSDVGAAAASHGTHVTYATATPSANGTAAVGSSAKVAREDHVHPLQTSISGAAGSAGKWTTARKLTIGNTGKDVDGSANVTWTLAEIGALPLTGGTMTGAITTPNNAQGIKVGDDAVICDRNIANHIVIEGATATSGGITFGSGKDTNIYRGGANLLKTDDTFNAVGGLQWNGESLDTRYAKASHGSHISFSTTTPKVAGTAAIGSDSGAARGDHVHPAQTSVSGNAGTATKLQTARNINGTAFDGTANITTANWGTARNIYIADSDGTNAGAAVSVNGSANATLKLPATIKATLSGNASTATKLAAARTINGTNFDGSANITTANWGTSRKINQISVNGSADVKIPLDYYTCNIGASNSKPYHHILTTGQCTGSYTDKAITIVITQHYNGGGLGIARAVLRTNDTANGATATGELKWLVRLGFNENQLCYNLRNTAKDAYMDIFFKCNGTYGSATWYVLTEGARGSHDSQWTKQSTHHDNGTHVYDETGMKAIRTYTSTLVTAEDAGFAERSNNAYYADDAGTATKWKTARTLTLNGAVTGSVSIDGSGNATLSTTVNHTHNYAGSSSAGGAATSANKVNSSLKVRLNNGTTEGTNQFTFDGSAAKTVNITPNAIGAAASSHGTHVTYSTSAPLVAGTAAVGSANNVARGDHVHPAQTSVTGNAGTATKLQNAKSITIGNKANTFDGSANISYTLAEIGAAASSHSHNTLSIKGTDTITSTTNDTTAKWGAQGTSVHWYTKTGQLTDQPSQWGYLLNIGQSSEVHQLWMTQSSGDLKHRGGNGSGWSGTWRTILDDSNYKTYVTPANIGAAAASHGTHVDYATATPKAHGTAAVGTSAKVAREDHVHPAQTSVSGNAGTATKLQTARTITIGNKSNSFDGSANISYTLADIGALATSGDTMSGNITFNNGRGIYGKTAEALTDSEGEPVAAGASGGLLVYNASHNLHLGALIYDKKLVTGSTYINGATNMFVRTNKGYVAMQPERTSTMTFYKTHSNTNVPLRSSVSAGTYLAGNQGTALLNSTATAGSYVTVAKTNSTNGYFTLNSFKEGMFLSYTAKSTVDAGTNAVTKTAKLIDESGNTSFPGTVTASAFSGNATSATKLQTAKNIKIGNATKSFNGTANVEFTLAEIGIGSSISAVASNLSGVTINGYDSILSGINTNIGKL